MVNTYFEENLDSQINRESDILDVKNPTPTNTPISRAERARLALRNLASSDRGLGEYTGLELQESLGEDRIKNIEGMPFSSMLDPTGPEDWRGSQQTRVDKLFNGIVVRFPTTTYTKLMEGIGYAATLPLWLATGDISHMTENAFSEFFAMAEETIKEDLAPIYTPRHVKDGNLLTNIGSLSFWMDEGVDAAAFFAGFAVLGYATAGISPALNALAKSAGLGAKAASKAGKIAQLGVATFLQTASEAGFEAAHFGKEFDHQIERELSDLETKLEFEGRTQEEIDILVSTRENQLKEEKAQAQANIFKTNVGILLGPNILMNKFLFGKMFNTKSNIISKIYDAETSTIKHLSRKELAKDIAQKAGLGVLSEGFWEEGMQETATKYFEKIALGETDLGFVSGMYETYIENLADVNFQKAIFLGGVLGSLGGGYSAVREYMAANKAAVEYADVLNRNPNSILDKLFSENQDLKSKDPKVFARAVKSIFEKMETISTITKLDAMADVFTILENESMVDFVANSGLLSWAYKLLNVEGGIDVLNNQIDKITEDAYNQYLQQQSGNKSKSDFAQFKAELKTKVANLQNIVNTVNSTYGDLLTELRNNEQLSEEDFDTLKQTVVNSVRFAQISVLSNIDFLKNLRNKKINEANSILAKNLVTNLEQLKALPDITKADLDVVEALTKQVEEINNVVSSLNKDFNKLTDKDGIQNYFDELVKANKKVEQDLEDALKNPQSAPQDVKEQTPEAVEEVAAQEADKIIEESDIALTQLRADLKAKKITKEEFDKLANEIAEELEAKMIKLSGTPVKQAAKETKTTKTSPVDTGAKRTVLEEEYEDSPTVQEDPKNTNPRQPFVGVSSFFRSTNAQHKFIKFIEDNPSLAPIYEPLIRFQQFIDKWTPKSKETLTAYTWGTFKQKFADKLSDNLITTLESSNQFRDDYSVILVLSNAKGEAVEVKSHFDANKTILQFAFMSDLTDASGTIQHNKRASGEELVDMKDTPNPEQAYRKAAEQFENSVRKAVLEASRGEVQSDIESKKADIERRRQEELGTRESRSYTKENGDTNEVIITEEKDRKVVRVRKYDKDGNFVGQYESTYKKELSNEEIYTLENSDEYTYSQTKQLKVEGKRTDAINAKYDAELAALETPQITQSTDIEVKKADIERRRREELENGERVNLVATLNNAKNERDADPSSKNKGKTDQELETIYREGIKKINDFIKLARKKGISNEKIAVKINNIIVNNSVLSFRKGIGNPGLSLVEHTEGIFTSEEINAKYDAELAALESNNTEQQRANIERRRLEKLLGKSFTATTEKVVTGKGRSSGKTVVRFTESKTSSDGEVLTIKPKAKFKNEGTLVSTTPETITVKEFREQFYENLSEQDKEMFDEFFTDDSTRIKLVEARIGLKGNTKGQVNIDVQSLEGQPFGFELQNGKEINAKYDAELAALETTQPTTQSTGLKLKITGKTSGLVKLEKDSRTLTKEEAKNLNILVPINETLTNEVTGETRNVRPGFIYAEVDGIIVPADRVRLEKQDRDNVINVLKNLMLNPTLENYTQAFELINTYTYMVHETTGRSEEFKNKPKSKFYVETSGSGTSTNYTAVVFGDNKITKKQLLSGETQALESFLADKFYSVDSKRLESGIYKTVESATPVYNEQGDLADIQLDIKTRTSGYKNDFLLNPKAPKLQFRLKKESDPSTIEGYTNPKAVNRSLRFAPAVPIVPSPTVTAEDNKTKETTKEDTPKSTKKSLPLSGIIKVEKGDTRVAPESGEKIPRSAEEAKAEQDFNLQSSKEINEALKKKVTPAETKTETKVVETKPEVKPVETKPKTFDDFITESEEALTPEQKEAAEKTVHEIKEKDTPSTKEIKKDSESLKKSLVDKINKGKSAGKLKFMTKNSDSPSIRGTQGLFEEYTAFRKVFKNVQISLTGLQALRQRDGALSTIDGVVRVLLNPFAAQGTLWHEGFHIKNLLFNTREEQIALYEALRKELGDKKVTFEVFEEVDGVSVPVKKTFVGKELPYDMAEEYLAEQFRAYMLAGKDNYKFAANESIKRNIFETIWNAILDAFEWLTGRKVNREEAAKNPEWLVREFENIGNGVFDVNTLTNLPRVVVDKIGNVPESTSKVMVNGVNSLFFKTAFELLDGATVLQNFDEFIPTIYATVKEALEAKIEAGQGSPVMELILNNWEDTVYQHYKFLRQYKIDIAAFEEVLQDENKGRDNANWFDSNTVDVRSNMQTGVKLLLASINQYNPDGTVVYEGGLPQSARYSRILNRIQYDLADAKDFNHMVEIMQAQSDKFPFYTELMTKLGITPADAYPVTATDFQISLQSMFYEQFNKANVEMLSMILGEANNNYLVESVSTSMSTRIIDTWKNNVKYRDPRTTGIFNLERGRFKLNPNGEILIGEKIYKLSELDSKKLNELNKDPNIDVYRDFIAAFGIAVNPEVTAVNDMKNISVGIFNTVTESTKNKTPLFIEDIFNRNITVINKELNSLAEYQAEFELDTVSGQYINEKGQTEHSIGLKNYIDRLVDTLNYTAKTKAALPEELAPFDPETGRGNISTYGSRWIENSEGGTTIKTGILRAFGRERGEKVDFDNLKPADNLALQLEAILNGYVPYIRSSDRKREYAFSFGKSKIIKIDQKTFKDELEHYLKAELVAAIAYVNNSEYGRFVKGKNDGQLNFFKDIVPSLNSVSAEYKGIPATQYVQAAEEIIAENKDVIGKALNEYIEAYRERTFKTLIENKLFSKLSEKEEFYTNAISSETLNRLKFPTIQYGQLTELEDTRKTALTRESLNVLIDTYNYYFTTAIIEETKLITGNINTYAVGEKSELFKRTTLFTSTGSPMQDSPGFNKQLNSNSLFKRLDGREHTSKYKQFTVKDVKVKSVYHNLYSFLIGNKHGKAYDGMKENDAAGGIFMDAFKAYHVRGKGWSEIQDKTWQYQAQILFKELLRLEEITQEQYSEMFQEHLPQKYSLDKFYYKGEEVTPYTKNQDGSYTYNLTQFSQKKPIAVGTIANEDLINFGKKATTKTALTLYLPSDYVGNDSAIKWMWDMMQNGVDFVYPESAEKAERVGNLDGELPSFYKEDGSRMTATEMREAGFIPTERFWKDMSDQLDIEPSGKERTADSTQKRRLIYLNSFELGKVSPGKEAIVESYNQYASLYNALTTKAIERLVDDLGLTGENYALEDVDKFVKILTDQFSRRELPDNAFEAVHMIFNLTQELKLFDALPNKRQFVNLLQGLVRSRAINLKISGDMLIQQASTGMESTNRDIKGSNFLKFYRPIDSQGNEIIQKEGESVEDFMFRVDSIAPAQAMISLPLKWIPFVDTFEGNTFEQKLENFNKAILDPTNKELYAEFKKIRTYIANRIPGQDLNSIEALEVIRFLSPFGGPRVVLPTEIVAKSGSDFDVDKLSTYFNNVKIDRKSKQPKYIEFIQDKKQLWEDYKNRKLNSKKAAVLLKELGINLGELSIVDNLGEALNRIVVENPEATKQVSDIFSLLEVDNTTLVIEELAEAGIMMTEEEFMSKSIEELNSKAAIENRLNEINKGILLNKNNFVQLITPNSPGIVRDAANELGVTEEVVSNHSLLEVSYNNLVTYNQLSNKAGVGIAANNSSAHALQQIHPIRVKTRALQILFPSFKSNESLVFGHIRDASGALISENNASVLTAFVDAASDVIPNTNKINLTTSTANTYSLLNRVGSESTAPVGFMEIAELINSEVVRFYEDRLRVNDAEFVKNSDISIDKHTLIERILTKDSKSPYYSKQLASIKQESRVFLYEVMENYIKTALNPRATETQKTEAETAVLDKIQEVRNIKDANWKNLEMYLYYQEASKLLNMLQQVTRPDTGLAKNRVEVFVKKRKLSRLLDSGIFEAEDIRAMLTDSYIRGFFQTQGKSLEMFNQFYIDQVSEEFRSFIWEEIADLMDNPVINRSEEKSAKAIIKITNATLNYILHTTKVGGVALNTLYDKLIKGENSLPRRLGRLKNELYNNPNSYPVLVNNPAIIEFTPIIEEFNVARDFKHATDYIKTFNRKYTVEESNAITEGIRELLNHSDPTINQIGRDLIDLAIIQSGVQVNPFSFFELLPAEVYFPRVMGIINEYFNSTENILDETAKDYIFANLINDDTVVPRVSRKSGVKKDAGQTLLINERSQNVNYEYLSKYIFNKITKKPELRLYKKVSDEIVEKHYVRYKALNIYGDPNRFFESYRESKPSIVTTNTKGTTLKYNKVTPTQPKEASTKIKGILEDYQFTLIPDYIIDTTLKNKDGSKRLASTDGTTIKINPVKTLQEFFDYIEGVEGGQSSMQKKLVFQKLADMGYPMSRIKEIITNIEDVNTFLALHENDHILFGDKKVYLSKGTDLLTGDKIDIETRATYNALGGLEFLKSGAKNLKPLVGTVEKSTRIITRQELRNNPSTLYLFGDNDIRKGLGGQAKQMRGEPNAIGISTKKLPSNAVNAFKTDAELGDNMDIIRTDINKAIKEWETGKYNKVVIPPIGVGLAKLQEKAPKTWQFLQEQLSRLELVVTLSDKVIKDSEVQPSESDYKGLPEAEDFTNDEAEFVDTEEFINKTLFGKESTPVTDKTIIVPEGSNPNNLPIFETDTKVYLMNDGQQAAYEKVKEFLLDRIETINKPMNLGNTVKFDNNLAKFYDGLIPQDMWDNMVGIIGKGGVGKTTVIKKIIEDFRKARAQQNKYGNSAVTFAAPTHTAATVLQEALGVDSEAVGSGKVVTFASMVSRNTIDGRTGQLVLQDKESYLKAVQLGYKEPVSRLGIIVIDEASMFSSEHLKDIKLRIAQEAEVGITGNPVFIIMGDYRQLPPIDANKKNPEVEGPLTSTLFTTSNKFSVLSQIMRSNDSDMHKTFDAVGDQITMRRDKFIAGEKPPALDLRAYDIATMKSSKNILVVTDPEGVIDDYTDTLLKSDNPYNIFWIHYNNLVHAKTKDLFNRIRKLYFSKLGISNIPTHFIKEDYVQYTLNNEVRVESLEKKGGSGTIKPQSRYKVKNIVITPTDLHSATIKEVYSSFIRKFFPNVSINFGELHLYNRQDKMRKFKFFENVQFKEEWKKNVGGRGTNVTITLTNKVTGETIVKSAAIPGYEFMKYSDVIRVAFGDVYKTFVPSYIGSSHTAQGNSIKQVIVGDYNIKENAVHVDGKDIGSSLYTALTRASKKLIIIKPKNASILNNQEAFEPYNEQQEMLQKSSRLAKRSNPQLNKALNKFLDALKVSVNNVTQIVSSNGTVWGDVDSGAIAIANIVQRTIDIIENRADITTLPEEAAHFYVELMGKTDPLYKLMMKDIVKYRIYEEVLSEYQDTYEGDLDRIKREAVAKVIATKIAGEKLDLVEQDKQAANWFRALWYRVKQWFNLSKNPFAQAAKEILDGEINRLSQIPESSVTQEMFRISNRLETLDDVAAAQIAENKRRKQAEEKSRLQSMVPIESTQVVENNNKELQKVSERDLAIQDIFRNFDIYFPDYSHWTNAEKLSFAESMDMFEIIC